tara:strand:- start:818 stop:1183 length:366 start_codon:yes stop_codon:yes gene_type:complete
MLLCALIPQPSSQDVYEAISVVSEIELAEFWEKIEGEMKPESIWGDAKTDQERCQAEANYMVKFNKLCHVGKCIGRFEGIGWSRSGNPKPNTCVPRYRMKLTGDATAIMENGTVVRVRSWR